MDQRAHVPSYRRSSITVGMPPLVHLGPNQQCGASSDRSILSLKLRCCLLWLGITVVLGLSEQGGNGLVVLACWLCRKLSNPYYMWEERSNKTTICCR